MSNISRCKYKKCPLLEVIYQFNFPAILNIESNSIADYQEAIRESFPRYKKHKTEEREINMTISDLNIEQEITKPKNKIIHIFVSEDGKWKITLASDYFAIATLEYNSYDDFVEKMKVPFDTFCKLYRPTYRR